MKAKYLTLLTSLSLGIAGAAHAEKASPATQKVEIKAVKEGDGIHWEPAEVHVTPGEHVEFVATHDLEGGADFHGFQITPLKVMQKVERHKPLHVMVTIPQDAKPGTTYAIGCQFHPKHVASKIVVDAKK